uniref:EF-hand domain-containing protein n=1 Tax=Phaeomonas parva TaxID=124430 RepID=A0A7S1TQ68_9STRA
MASEVSGHGCLAELGPLELAREEYKRAVQQYEESRKEMVPIGRSALAESGSEDESDTSSSDEDDGARPMGTLEDLANSLARGRPTKEEKKKMPPRPMLGSKPSSVKAMRQGSRFGITLRSAGGVRKESRLLRAFLGQGLDGMAAAPQRVDSIAEAQGHSNFRPEDACIVRKLHGLPNFATETWQKMTKKARLRSRSHSEFDLFHKDDDAGPKADDDEAWDTAQEREKLVSKSLFAKFRSMHTAKTKHRPNSARFRFLSECDKRMIAPLPIFDQVKVTNQNLVAMSLPNYGIGQAMACALGAYLGYTEMSLCVLDLSQNSIRDEGLENILRSLKNHHSLKTLDIRGNKMGNRSAFMLAQYLSEYAPSTLQELSIAHTGLNTDRFKLIVAASMPYLPLRKLDVSRNDISGAGEDLKEFLGKCSELEEIDISWNSFRLADALHVAQGLRAHDKLECIDASWNHFGCDKAMQALALCVRETTTIKRMDLSFNFIKERGSIQLAHALGVNTSIRVLMLDGNPVGPRGGKALLRQVVKNGDMKNISLLHCNFDVPEDGPTPFDPQEPNGFYRLDLSSDYDRMVALQLQELAYSQGGECWRGEKLDGKLFDFPEDPNSGWEVPHQGILELAFVANKPIESETIDAEGFESVVKTVQHTLKNETEEGTEKMIKSLGAVYNFSADQVAELIGHFENGNPKVLAAADLFTQMTDPENAELIMRRLNQLERRHVETLLGNYYFFNGKNPTGHYSVNLAMKYDNLLVQRLMDVNRTEGFIRRKTKKRDLSQKGNYSCFRNERLNDEPIAITVDWQLPDEGLLTFDYVSTTRPEGDIEPADPDTFGDFVRQYITMETETEMTDEEVCEIFATFDRDGSASIEVDEVAQILWSVGMKLPMEEVERMVAEVDENGNGSIDVEEFILLWKHLTARFREKGRIASVRRASSSLYISAYQLRQMMRRVPLVEEKVELFVIFFCRVVDEANLAMPLALLDDIGKKTLAIRLGPLSLFNPFAPAGKYKLDLSMNDHHMLAGVIIQLSVGEKGQALQNTKYNGVKFPIPVSWLSEVPKKGVFEVEYAVEEGCENMKLRKRLAEDFLEWEFPDDDDEWQEIARNMLQGIIDEDDVELAEATMNDILTSEDPFALLDELEELEASEGIAREDRRSARSVGAGGSDGGSQSSPRKSEASATPRKSNSRVSKRMSEASLSPRKSNASLSPRKSDASLSPRSHGDEAEGGGSATEDE